MIVENKLSISNNQRLGRLIVNEKEHQLRCFLFVSIYEHLFILRPVFFESSVVHMCVYFSMKFKEIEKKNPFKKKRKEKSP